MASLITLTLDTEEMLYGSTPEERPAVDTLATAVTNAADVAWRFALAGAQFWERGDFAEYVPADGTAGEIIRFSADHSTAATDVTVLRAQKRTTAAAHTAIGTATYDEAGGALDDLWTTSAAHGKAVGDQVVFTVAGTGATGYAINTTYYVAAVPAATTLTLSATSGGAAIAGTGDGTGWTIVTPALAAGLMFQKNPRHNRTEIQRVINAVIDEDLQHGIWYRSNRTLSHETGRVHYELNASDFEVEKMYQHDLNSAGVGTFSYDETGGALGEDLFTTTAAHGLSVGDPVRFTTAGTAITGYAANTVYWVAAVPSTLTCTLSATEGGSAIEGTGDATGWILERVYFSVREFPREWYGKMIPVASTLSSTGRSVLVHRVLDEDRTVHYVAKTHPSSSAISSLPAEIAGMIPWGVLARLTGGTSVRGRYDGSATQTSAVAYADASFFLNTFQRLRDQYREKLRAEHEPTRKFTYGPTSF